MTSIVSGGALNSTQTKPNPPSPSTISWLRHCHHAAAAAAAAAAGGGGGGGGTGDAAAGWVDTSVRQMVAVGPCQASVVVSCTPAC